MKTKICTSIEQSKKLIELRIDKNTADMHYFYDGYNPTKLDVGYDKDNAKYYRGTENKYIPAWSLSALLQLMPITCDVIKDFHNRYYCSNKFDDNDFDTWHLTTSCENPIDAAVEMVVWLLKNGYIKD